MTDSSDPSSPSHRKPRPAATIDLDATVVDEGRRDEPTAAEAERQESEREAIAREIAANLESEGAEAGAAAGDPLAEPPPVREPAGARIGGILAAALLGGVVGAALLFALQQWRAGPQAPDPRIAALESRVAALPPQDALRALGERVTALQSAQTAVAAKADAAQEAAARAASRADEALARPLPPAPAAAAASSPQDAQALADLGARVAALEGQARTALEGATGAIQRVSNTIQGIDSRLGEQEKKLSGLDQRLAAQDQASGRVGERVATLDQRLGALSQKVAEEGSDTARAGTRVVLSGRLLEALRDGAPYAETLAALQRVGADPQKLKPLEPFAGTGAPTAAALAAGFEPVEERILRDSRPGDGGWRDRLARMAERIVTIRAVDDPSGTSVPALVGRIESSLERGAVAAAASAFAALPEPARAAAGEWGRTLEQRAAADAAARAVSAEAVAALTPATR